MANVEKEIKRSYKLELSEGEYFAIMCLIGRTSYDAFKQRVSERYSVRLGRDEKEDFDILTDDEYNALYDSLENNK